MESPQTRASESATFLSPGNGCHFFFSRFAAGGRVRPGRENREKGLTGFLQPGVGSGQLTGFPLSHAPGRALCRDHGVREFDEGRTREPGCRPT